MLRSSDSRARLISPSLNTAAGTAAVGVVFMEAAEAGFMVAVAVAAFTAAEVVAHSTEVAEAARIAAVEAEHTAAA